jgi:hypothetical protein
MYCFDCAQLGHGNDAVAICVGCGAAVCLQHSQVEVVWLTRTEAINRVVRVESPARAVRCGVCAAAHDAATADPSHPRLAGVRR